MNQFLHIQVQGFFLNGLLYKLRWVVLFQLPVPGVIFQPREIFNPVAGIQVMYRAVLVPGNPIGGRSVAVKTWGRIIDEMVLRAEVSVKSALGENPKRTYGQRAQTPATRLAVAGLQRAAFVAEKQEEYARDIGVWGPAAEMYIDDVVPGYELRTQLAERLRLYRRRERQPLSARNSIIMRG